MALDVNAVPPAGLEGVGAFDDGKAIEGDPGVGVGALAVGNVKFRTEHGLLASMRDAEPRRLSASTRRSTAARRHRRWLSRLLVCALSGRALAQSARAAGFAPLVLDRFGDLDTRAAAGRWRRRAGGRHGPFARRPCSRRPRRLAPPRPAGLGRRASTGRRACWRPSRAAATARQPAGALRRVTDPLRLRRALRRARRAASRPCRARCRPTCGLAGQAPRRFGRLACARAGGGRRLAPGDYVQRRVAGRAVSVLLLGDGRARMALALSEQWQAGSPPPLHRRAAAGGVSPPRGSGLGEAAVARGRAHGLRGLASADFLLEDDGRFHLLEINARPGASLEAAELALGCR